MGYQPQPGPAAGSPRARNEQSHAQMRRDTWLQMVAPLALATLLMVVLLVLVILPVGAGVRAPLADVALMLCIIPVAIASLIGLALLLGLNYGVFLGITRLPPYFKIGQDFVSHWANTIRGGVKKASDAVIAARSALAAAQRTASDLGARLPFQRRD
jgi:hypothetical protein